MDRKSKIELVVAAMTALHDTGKWRTIDDLATAAVDALEPPHQPPRYTLDEIDRMRAAVRSLAVANMRPGFLYPGNPHDGDEDRLRTYMQNGTTVEELERRVAEEWRR